MRSTLSTLAGAMASAAIAHAAASLDSVCTSAYVNAVLPVGNANLTAMGITINSAAVSVAPVLNTTVSDQDSYPDGTFDYCDVVISYSHNGADDEVLLNFWLPTPSNFQKRWLSTGGFAYAINSGTTSSGSLPGGLVYGAVSGLTDGGFGSFTTEFDDVFPLAAGTPNYPALYSFGYTAHHEMTTIGKLFTKSFFNMTSSEKLYAYYQACSEGGREGLSQVQRFANDWDGAIIGAPAIRFSFQQLQHLQSNLVELEVGYYPSPCEFTKILNETIAFCDPLDGKTDGVISRSDLCSQQIDLDSFIGKSYYCAATTGGGGFGKVKRQFGGGASTPAQNGTVSAKAIQIAKQILKGLQDSEGRQVYFSYQIGSTWTDAATTYNTTTKTWGLDIDGIGAEFAARFLSLQNSSTLSTLDYITYDVLKDMIYEGWQRYEDSLHTTWPDLTPFQEAGGKILHYHGESDYSIPTASSIRYWNSVRQVMYPNLSLAKSTAQLKEWYRLYLVPGAGHCAPSTTQPNGPFPQTNLGVMINWVEKGVMPTTLNATHLAGDNIGSNAQICAWPLRPLWKNNGTTMKCVQDQASIQSFLYDLNAFDMPVY